MIVAWAAPCTEKKSCAKAIALLGFVLKGRGFKPRPSRQANEAALAAEVCFGQLYKSLRCAWSGMPRGLTTTHPTN